MKKRPDLLRLLEEAQTVAQALYGEKGVLGDHIKNLKAEVSALGAEKARLIQAMQTPPTKADLMQEVQKLQTHNTQLTQELQDTKTQLSQAVQAPPPPPDVAEIEAKLSKLRAEKTQEIWNLQEINAHLSQELQESKTQLAKALQGLPPNPGSSQDVQALQAANARLTKELQEAKARLAQGSGGPSAQTALVEMEAKLSKLQAEKTQETGKLQAINARLVKELQEVKAQLAHAVEGHSSLDVPSGEVKTVQSNPRPLSKGPQEVKPLQGQDQEGGADDSNIVSLAREVQSLKEQLQQQEIHNQLLEREVVRQQEEIQVLERNLESATAQPPDPSPNEDPKVSTSSGSGT